MSKSAYHHGYFSASIKLPDDHTAGVVVAFYLSNGDVFPHNHDEVDFELLGNRHGHEWRVQTNVYGNGSTTRGREERYLLPFDPTLRHHAYAISWTPTVIVFYIDKKPIREVVRVASMGGDFPSKPMSVYATIWDGSSWATDGGRYKVDYAHAPFVAEFSNFVLSGCPLGHGEFLGGRRSSEGAGCDVAVMTAEFAGEDAGQARRNAEVPAAGTSSTRCATTCTGTMVPSSRSADDTDGTEREDFHKWGESKRVSPSRRGYTTQQAGGGARMVTTRLADAQHVARWISTCRLN
ncbi:hypothetical protein HU200_000659 [Digitaria exilis]|uniref:GH16 domain-containing protein n=1 Tax=Digitaria exilis TaxID=1010633 RepID=A0A835G056_9POAL|nr:hypothetical protein HU200_000659 [Digitaria exilis]